MSTQPDVEMWRREANRALHGGTAPEDCERLVRNGWIEAVDTSADPIRGPNFARSPSFMWTHAGIRHLENVTVWSDVAEQAGIFRGVVLAVVRSSGGAPAGALIAKISHIVATQRDSRSEAASDAELVVTRWLASNPTFRRRPEAAA